MEELNFSASGYRIKIIINNLTNPLIILFQGFYSEIIDCNNIDCNNMNMNINILNTIPNYMENTFKDNKNYNFLYVTDLFQIYGSIDAPLIFESLKNIIDYYKASKIICIGQSGGDI